MGGRGVYSGGGGGGGAAAGTSLAARRAQRQRERREKKALDKQKQAQSKAKAEAAASRAAAGARAEAGVAVTAAAEAAPGVGPRSRSGGAKRNIGGGAWSDGVGGGARKVPPTKKTKRSAAAHIPALAPSPSNNKRAKVRRNGHEAHDDDASGDEDDDDGFDEDEDEDADDDDGDHDAAAAAAVEEVPSVTRTGAYGSYGRTGGRMSAEDDEWATSSRTWASLSPYLSKFHEKKVWMPFYYDGAAGRRLKRAGFRRVVHRREDFFSRVNDGPFIRSVDVVVDNPPYTGKGMKERVLTALVNGGIPFCLLLPLGVLHGAMVRQLLDPAHVQALIPRRCWVSKAGGKEVPFKYLVWLCYKLELDRDLVLMPET